MTEKAGGFRLPPEPKIEYHPYFEGGYNSLFTVELNSFTCGKLMQELGMPDEKIADSSVTVTTETGSDSLKRSPARSVVFRLRDKKLFYMPSRVWNLHKLVSADVSLLRTGSSEVVQLRGEGPLMQISRGYAELDTNDSAARGKVEGRVRKNLELLFGKKRTQSFFKRLDDEENPEEAMEMLREGSRKALIESLAYGLYKLANPADEYNLAQKTAVLYGPKVLTILAVYAELSLPSSIRDNNIALATLIVPTVLCLYPALTKMMPPIVGEFNIREYRAGRFARSIGNDPRWNSLVTAENGWN